GRGARFASTNAKRIPTGDLEEAGKPSWDVPAGWRESLPGPPLLARFDISGDAGQAQVTVISLPRDAGGLLANVNRWRGQQLGLNAASESDLSQLVTPLDVMGGKAMLVDMNGQNPQTGKKVRLIPAIVPRAGQAWFYNLM